MAKTSVTNEMTHIPFDTLTIPAPSPQLPCPARLPPLQGPSLTSTPCRGSLRGRRVLDDHQLGLPVTVTAISAITGVIIRRRSNSSAALVAGRRTTANAAAAVSVSFSVSPAVATVSIFVSAVATVSAAISAAASVSVSVPVSAVTVTITATAAATAGLPVVPTAGQQATGEQRKEVRVRAGVVGPGSGPPRWRPFGT